MIKKVKNTFRGQMLPDIITEKKLLERLWKRTAKKKSKKFRVKEAIKRKCDKLYVKWKSHDNFFNGGINKKT